MPAQRWQPPRLWHRCQPPEAAVPPAPVDAVSVADGRCSKARLALASILHGRGRDFDSTFTNRNVQGGEALLLTGRGGGGGGTHHPNEMNIAPLLYRDRMPPGLAIC